MAAAAARPATSSTADAPATSGDCSSDVQDLMANCQDYVMFPADPKIDPSQACCAAVQRANMPCVCNKVIPEVEQLICMDKVVYVVAFCKKPFQPGSNCGRHAAASAEPPPGCRRDREGEREIKKGRDKATLYG
ncbi:hypothetical protein DAI22_01g365700 [Oryza sativa Japonica Group]|nr:hypothetical protein DAI22_01g365700 [Oryza sativa Japonica Group]